MKPQEIWSQTYHHLWEGANIMLATAPAVSGHLARRLVSSVPKEGMSALATRLHCQECSALMINAKVRVRKPTKRARRASRSQNLVLRTCSACDRTNAEKGTKKVSLSETCLEEIAELRKRIEEQRRNDAQSSKGGSERDRRTERKKKDGQRGVTDGRIKKKKKKGRSPGNSNNDPGALPRTGLAASFLFDPIT